jgi:hypothetical protein
MCPPAGLFDFEQLHINGMYRQDKPGDSAAVRVCAAHNQEAQALTDDPDL